jgi:hypothetical protein
MTCMPYCERMPSSGINLHTRAHIFISHLYIIGIRVYILVCAQTPPSWITVPNKLSLTHSLSLSLSLSLTRCGTAVVGTRGSVASRCAVACCGATARTHV